MDTIENKPTKVNQYATPKEAMAVFGLSPRSLLRLRTDGIFKAGKCWIRKNPTSPNSDVLYNLAACEQALIDATIETETQLNSNS
jgi:hypothetical protein